MRRLLIFLTLICTVAFVMQACSKDPNPNNPSNFWNSYGVVKNLASIVPEESPYMIILRDDGARMYVTQNAATDVQASVGQRVAFTYNIIGTRPEVSVLAYNIKLIQVANVTAKVPVYESFIEQNPAFRNDSIGNDRIYLSMAWFGGNYLNITYGVRSLNGNAKHLVSLVYDDIKSEKGTATVTVRHNAYGADANMTQLIYGVISFDISKLVPQGTQSIKVNVKWTDYNGVSQSATDTYTPYSYNAGIL